MRHYDYTPRFLWCLLTLLLLLPTGKAHGQTSERHVTARIVNAETGAPIVDVLCSAWDGERHRTAFTQSDAKGEARFRLTPQDQFLSFVLLGYTKQELRISELSRDSFTVRLQPLDDADT